jgi:hypothetical protein
MGTKPNGHTCGSNAECTFGNCVDGYCCNSSCGGSCQACDIAGSIGVCITVPSGQQPHGSRAACNGAGSAPCGGYCDGSSTSCTYPTGSCNSCTTISVGGTVVRVPAVQLASCQSGACVPSGSPTGCGGYTCSSGACLTGCCGSGGCDILHTCSRTSGCFLAGSFTGICQ